MTVTKLSELGPWSTTFHHFGMGSVGSCRGILHCVQLHSEENFLLLWKILFLCFTNLAKSLNVNFSSEMEARKLWLSRYKIKRLFGSSLAFFINTFCRVISYKQLKRETNCRDYNFIKEEKTNKKARHSNICRRNRGPNHSWFHTRMAGVKLRLGEQSDFRT